MHIALDIGNVLCRFDLKYFSIQLKEIAKIPEDIPHELFSEGIEYIVEMGAASIEDAILMYFPTINKSDLDLLHDSWVESVVPLKETTNLLNGLLNNGHIVALLSNIGSDHAELLREINVYNRCIQHFSFEVGARKPQKLYYQSFIMEHPEFKRSKYIDDLTENITAGQSYGLNSTRFALSEFEDNAEAVQALHQAIAS